ncbi:disulfide bond formation protein B [Neptuniibacter sp.]|uniref:disulfide bond formation protein B n=1 Tax=Neptuniibacter sp. TaxID=1962643 RepID=UPI002611B701|nr:disulfide bond formation protein B [Neptuniibacter sp.]MCP4598152.1 disulfide bond formation protein B [Neptuniibacter sp.]
MLNKLACLSRSSWYWLSLIALGVSMEAVALFYQYVLDYGPCVLCIHVRIWIAALVLIAILGLFTRRYSGLAKLSHLLVLVTGIGLFERSWKTLGVERGWIIEACSMDSGLPDWFALDKWMPHMFEPWEPCGYTPELLFRITMAEGLVAFSAVLCVIGLIFLLLQFRKN